MLLSQVGNVGPNPVLKIAYLSLGSNLGDRAQHLEDAIRLLEQPDLKVLRRSSIYETEPRDSTAQPWFLNLVLEIETRLFPVQLLARVLKVETRLGRKRLAAKGPRTIDLDIVLYGSIVMDTPALTIPHPRMHERRFVLEPLVELEPDLRHPVTHETCRAMLSRVASQKAVRIKQS
jgi:2-amino-4-hydroxy-6-hydroxymethyldihydropteridine diphosphokinase